MNENKETIPTLDFVAALKLSTSRVAQFDGRARRSEYWWTMLVVWIAGFVLTPVVGFVLSVLTIPLVFRRLHDIGKSGWWWGAGAMLKAGLVMSVIYDIAAMSISTASHDFGGYGVGLVFAVITKYVVWNLLIVAYELLMLFFMCKDGDPYENEYGGSPKYVMDDGGDDSGM
ncbi:DUF805 domain-containing protein [Palleniella muris]|uniref:DUF805 domain-containing protein n=1 Tax=Palleniella muris TaxID=3038145 RepID=A0AC61QTH1_9BACT|nr:DUF805 domain-containing protein [Palleniella muris]TGX83859.1 DUF805 domain-containing protein [Palleniella muris]